MVKINAAWFHRTERGTFSGIFGGMIQLGKAGIGILGPWILSGMIVFGNALIGTGEWVWLFRIPPLLTVAAVIFLTLAVKQTPDEAGFPKEIEDEIDNSDGVTVSLAHSFKTIFTNPFVWFYATAYAATGAVRHSSDQLSNLFFQDQLGVNMKAAIPALLVVTFAIEPFVSFFGSLISGVVSDKFYRGQRAPVAMVLYTITALVCVASAVVLKLGWLVPGQLGIALGAFFVLAISFTVNSTHSLVGAAAPMDIGGKKMAGFASGVIDPKKSSWIAHVGR
jgi:OPA family glycerol-3-phosphate transporter-like MFS transporter